ncbi:hypothetical protein J2Z66_003908 [Paenibacillus eucommiae]|uniref:Uncharacterized protein n=1 Tax=Paenibacillus eucommiae TaxID=1355755 RepID=A0ABS4IXJ0_9BACL|nr:hypothetical protein [Paenibacillus eucommiae]
MSVRISAGLLECAKERWCPLQLLASHSRPLPLVILTTLAHSLPLPESHEIFMGFFSLTGEVTRVTMQVYS